MRPRTSARASVNTFSLFICEHSVRAPQCRPAPPPAPVSMHLYTDWTLPLIPDWQIVSGAWHNLELPTTGQLFYSFIQFQTDSLCIFLHTSLTCVSKNVAEGQATSVFVHRVCKQTPSGQALAAGQKHNLKSRSERDHLNYMHERGISSQSKRVMETQWVHQTVLTIDTI